MTPTWKFRLLNTGSNLERLSQTWGSRQDFSIEKEEPDEGHLTYWLSSPWLDGLTDLHLLSNRLHALKCLIDGALLLHAPPPIALDGIWDSGEATDSCDISYPHGRLLIDSAVGVEAGRVVRLPEPVLATGIKSLFGGLAPRRSRAGTLLGVEPVGASVFLARHDELARGCLLCIGYSGITFVSLYQCRDFMKRDPGGRGAALQASGASESDLKRFDHTANNFQASGPIGRHGEQGHQAPSNPMSETEARRLFLPLISKFLEQRASAAAIEQHWNSLPP